MREPDFLLCAFMLSMGLYAMMWLAFQTSGGLLNPAIAVSVGFNDQWNHIFTGVYTDPLWGYFWLAWLIGPFIGTIFASPLFDAYKNLANLY
jgi:glycerol uptake facilitator-like aquaporin